MDLVSLLLNYCFPCPSFDHLLVSVWLFFESWMLRSQDYLQKLLSLSLVFTTVFQFLKRSYIWPPPPHGATLSRCIYPVDN